jgi:hypothetical protein
MKHVDDDLETTRDDAIAARSGQPHKAAKPKAKGDDKPDPPIALPAPQPVYAPGETVDTYA